MGRKHRTVTFRYQTLHNTSTQATTRHIARARITKARRNLNHQDWHSEASSALNQVRHRTSPGFAPNPFPALLHNGKKPRRNTPPHTPHYPCS